MQHVVQNIAVGKAHRVQRKEANRLHRGNVDGTHQQAKKQRTRGHGTRCAAQQAAGGGRRSTLNHLKDREGARPGSANAAVRAIVAMYGRGRPIFLTPLQVRYYDTIWRCEATCRHPCGNRRPKPNRLKRLGPRQPLQTASDPPVVSMVNADTP